MIRKLRWKFVCINMSLILLVLLAIFTSLMVTTWRSASADTMRTLMMAADKGSAPFFRGQHNGEKKQQLSGSPIPAPEMARVSICMVELDANGEITSFTGMEQLFTDEAAMRQTVQDILADGREDGVVTHENLRYAVKQIQDGTTRIALADRSNEIITMNNLIRNSVFVGVGSILVFLIISIFLARWAVRPVEEAWRRQKQFVADASHELKTPLTVILANIGIVLVHREETVDKQKKWLGYIQTEATRMASLVNDLLYLAKADASETAPILTACSLSDAAEGCALAFEPVAYEQGKTLESGISPGITIQGDSGKLEQLFAILTDNAIKYSEPGGTVKLTLRREPDRAVVTVHNTGNPISPEHLPHIFERFYRVDESRARQNGGYGLGLAIAKSIVAEHHGKITVHSTAQEGTVFTVSFAAKAEP